MKESLSIPVEHVSDTAYMVAAARAAESERPDALFKDPYAGLLAGDKAEKLSQQLAEAHSENLGKWMVILRTVAIDEFILRAVNEGFDTILNLAAGLDTRPYRLELPESVLWVEADFPELVEYKTKALDTKLPKCNLERVGIDLRIRDDRSALFDRVNAHAKKVLVLTEGLLNYLTHDDVISLAEDLAARPHFAGWLMDIVTQPLLDWLKANLSKLQHQKSADVRLQFVPENGAKFFQSHGWKVKEFRSFEDEAQMISRTPPPDTSGSEHFAKGAKNSGVCLLVPSIQ